MQVRTLLEVSAPYCYALGMNTLSETDIQHRQTDIFSPSLCHIDLGAIQRNFARLGQATAMMPVIKADAYGHGLLPVAQALAHCGAVRFAVGTVDEGLALRAAGLRQQIVLLLGARDAQEWQAAAAHNLTPLAGSFADLHLARAAAQVSIAIKCETGMGRLGFNAKEMPHLLDVLRQSPQISPTLVLSHLSSADMPDEEAYTQAQIRQFAYMANALRSVFPELPRSLANSAATLRLPETHYEICRPGIALYGGNPLAGTLWEEKGHSLEWAMSVSAPVLALRHLSVGESVSYGRAFKATRPTRLAVVGSGYATGFARALSNHAEVLVNGFRAPQVGRVCMGMLMVDVTDAGAVQPGDNVWLMGGAAAPGQQAVSAQELASRLTTIPYEILCLMGATNRRVYSSTAH